MCIEKEIAKIKDRQKKIDVNKYMDAVDSIKNLTENMKEDVSSLDWEALNTQEQVEQLKLRQDKILDGFERIHHSLDTLTNEFLSPYMDNVVLIMWNQQQDIRKLEEDIWMARNDSAPGHDVAINSMLKFFKYSGFAVSILLFVLLLTHFIVSVSVN